LALLVYETTDPEFAEQALSAMREQSIPCYRVGHGYSNASAAFARGVPTESQICLYIERDGDYVAANRILISLGAVVEKPIPMWAYVGFAAFALFAVVWVVLSIK
jgi:hypothetical protein